jgi:hypothetical protein
VAVAGCFAEEEDAEGWLWFGHVASWNVLNDSVTEFCSLMSKLSSNISYIAFRCPLRRVSTELCRIRLIVRFKSAIDDVIFHTSPPGPAIICVRSSAALDLYSCILFNKEHAKTSLYTPQDTIKP